MNRLYTLKIITMLTCMAFTNFAFAYGDSQRELSNNNPAQSERTDTAITADIKAKFIKEKLFGDKDISAMSISVETNNGIVRLTGTAENNAQIKNAEKLASSVAGVKKVTNNVKIDNSENE